MPVWQVALVLNLTLAVGLGLGYAAWGRRVEALDREFDAARVQVERLERERQACAAGARGMARRMSSRCATVIGKRRATMGATRKPSTAISSPSSWPRST